MVELKAGLTVGLLDSTNSHNRGISLTKNRYSISRIQCNLEARTYKLAVQGLDLDMAMAMKIILGFERARKSVLVLRCKARKTRLRHFPGYRNSLEEGIESYFLGNLWKEHRRPSRQEIQTKNFERGTEI